MVSCTLGCTFWQIINSQNKTSPEASPSFSPVLSLWTKDCLNQASRGAGFIFFSSSFLSTLDDTGDQDQPQEAPDARGAPDELVLESVVHSLVLCWDPISGTPCESRAGEELGLVGKLDRLRKPWWAARKQWARRSSENIISRLIREGFEKETLKQPRRLVGFGQLSWHHAHLTALRHV